MRLARGIKGEFWLALVPNWNNNGLDPHQTPRLTLSLPQTYANLTAGRFSLTVLLGLKAVLLATLSLDILLVHR